MAAKSAMKRSAFLTRSKGVSFHGFTSRLQDQASQGVLFEHALWVLALAQPDGWSSGRLTNGMFGARSLLGGLYAFNVGSDQRQPGEHLPAGLTNRHVPEPAFIPPRSFTWLRLATKWALNFQLLKVVHVSLHN